MKTYETTATLLFQNKGEIGYWDLILLLSYLIYREIEVEVDLRKSLVVEEITEEFILKK